MINNKNNQSGLTIVEMLVSVIIISLVMSLLFTLLIQVKNANESSSAKSNLLISQAVITKTLEQDMVEIGVSAISNCSIGDSNTNFFDSDQVDSSKETACVRIEFNKTYSNSDVAYLFIYKQSSSQFKDPAWIIRYSRGYYDNCVKGNQPSTSSSWVETYTVVQRLESNINLSTPKAHITYSSDYDSTVKYANQKVNTVNLTIPITDDLGYKYDLDFSSTYKIIADDEEVGIQDTDVFMCDDTNSTTGITCDCVGNYCSHSYASNRDDSYVEVDGVKQYRYYCKDTKELTNLANGMNIDFLSISAVKRSGVKASNIATITFSNKASVEGWDDPYDVSYVQNKSTKMFVKKNSEHEGLYDILFCQSGGVTIYGNSINGMFRGFTSLYQIDLDGLVTSGIKNMSYLFYGCTSLTNSGLKGLSTLDYDTVTTMNSMFGKCSNLKVSPFRTSDTTVALELPVVTNVDSLFQLSGLTSFTYGLDLNTPKVANMNNMLANCTSLTNLKFNSIALNDKNGSSVYISSLDNLRYMIGFCSECTGLTSVDVSNFNFNAIQSFDSFFYKCSKLISINFKLSGLSDTLTSIVGMFEGTGFTEINSDMIYFDICQNADVSNLFSFCDVLLKANIDVISGLSGAANISRLFYNCTKLEEVTGNFNFYNATNAESMFANTVLRSGYELMRFPELVYASAMFSGVIPKSGSDMVTMDLDFNWRGFTKTIDFRNMFYNATFRTISFGFSSGSEVTSGTINLTKMFGSDVSNNSILLKSVQMFGTKFKANVDCTEMFTNRNGLLLTHFPDSETDFGLEFMKNYYEGGDEYQFYNEYEFYPFKEFIDGDNGGRISSLKSMFYGCSSLKGIPRHYFSSFVLADKSNLNYMFKYAINSNAAVTGINYKYSDMVVYIPFKIETTGIGSMFEGATNLAGVSFEYLSYSSNWAAFLNFGNNPIITTFTFEFKYISGSAAYSLFNGSLNTKLLPYAKKICFIAPNNTTYMLIDGRCGIKKSSSIRSDAEVIVSDTFC